MPNLYVGSLYPDTTWDCYSCVHEQGHGHFCLNKRNSVFT